MGEMAPSTGYLSVWDLVSDGGTGVQFCFPDSGNPDRVCQYRELPNFSAVFCRERALVPPHGLLYGGGSQ